MGTLRILLGTTCHPAAMQANGPRRINPQPVASAVGARLGDLLPPSGMRSGPAGGNSFTFATPTSGPPASAAAAPPPRPLQPANGVPEGAPGPAGNVASASGAKRKAGSQADGAAGAKGPKRVAPERLPTVPDAATPVSLGGTPRARVGTPVQGGSGAAQDALQQQPLMPALPVVQQVGPLLQPHASLPLLQQVRPLLQQVSPLLQQVSPLLHLHPCLCSAACAAWVQHPDWLHLSAPPVPCSLHCRWCHSYKRVGSCTCMPSLMQQIWRAVAPPVSAPVAASVHLCACLCPGCIERSQRLRQVQLEAHQLLLWLQQEQWGSMADLL